MDQGANVAVFLFVCGVAAFFGDMWPFALILWALAALSMVDIKR